MNNLRHLSPDDLALFALQLLEGDELNAALDHLEQCETCRHDVARFQGDLVGYAFAQSPLHTPPAAARDRLLKAVAKEKKHFADRPVAPLRRSSAAVPIAQMPSAQPPAATQPALPTLEDIAPTLAQRREFQDRGPAAIEDDPQPERELFLASRGRGLFDTDTRDDERVVPMRRRERKSSPAAAILGFTGWAIAAALAVAAFLQFRERENLQNELNTQSASLAHANSSLDEAEQALHVLTDTGAMQVSLHIPPPGGTPQPPQPEGHAAYDAHTGSLVFIADHLGTLNPGKTYELWLLPEGKDGAPVPAGLFKPDVRGIATLVLPDIPKGLPAGGFGVTIENDGGSKTPTAPIYLVGM